MTNYEAADHLIHIAENYLRKKSNAEALRYVEEAVRIAPKSVRAYLLKGECENNLGLTPKAVNSFNAALALDPDNSEALLNIAIVSIRAGDYNQAKKLAGRVLEKSSNNIALELLGDLAVKQRRFEEAIESYEQAMKTFPSKAKLYYKKACCHYVLGQYKEAFRNAEITCELDPAHPDAKPLSEKAAYCHFYRDAGLLVRMRVKIFGQVQIFNNRRQLKDLLEIREDMNRINKRTEELSVDPKMNIRNSAYFEAKARPLVELCQKNNRPVSFIFMDMDHMKMYNETYGHDKLDKVLGMIGEAFNKTVSADDLAARFGGDEFVLILPNADKIQAQKTLADFLGHIKEMNAKLPALGIDKEVTLSIGIASAPQDMEPTADSWADQLRVKADRAALYAKHHGRNRIILYDLQRKEEFEQTKQTAENVAKEKAAKGERP